MSSCPAITNLESSVALPSATARPSLLLGHLVGSRLRPQLLRLRAWLHRAGQLLMVAISSAWMIMSCKAIIGGVAAFDTYLTIKYAESLDVYEQNPLGRWLMGLDIGPVCDTQQIAAFITAKFVGTLLVLLAIQSLAYWRMRVAGLVATPVAAAQLYLIMHLMFAEG